ncbi:SAF domain-containing protein [Dermatobacter hominis]|uniref:SAF domain-containing protein n=1 Tax=Dermatobacter hominis TaxID=2884263 RepID=UPI001D11092A|nr:SAF domain-containing protein [Dermatobacter hominis]UDY35798.1 SAF domain-containing protein [Dermatobacter hominis]
MVVAAAGVLAAHRAAAAPPTTRVVVVTRDVPAGTVLDAADLGTVAVDLPAGATSVAGDDAQDVVGAVARHDLHEMDLLRPSDTGRAEDEPAPGSVVVPVEVERSRALTGTVRTGSRVDVLATDPDGAGTRVLATDVLVVAVDDEDDGLGAGDGVRFRLALADATAATSVVDASVRSQLTLVLPDQRPTDGADRG